VIPTDAKVLVVIDDRERSSLVPEELENSGQIDLRFERLLVGDYCVDGAVVFERKTASDFADSLVDGRLFLQASRLAASALRTAYILEGTALEWSALGPSREALQGAFITLMLIFDIPVLRSTGPADSARLIIFAGHQLMRLRDPHHAPYRQRKAKRRRPRQLGVLRGLPGIGPDRAQRMLERFGTLRACFNASKEQLLEVEGIGPKIAAVIHNLLN
jgi:DNA excision repair protein ERCC-4